MGWERFLAREPLLQWLVLVPDNAFVFTEELESRLDMYDPSTFVWLGHPTAVTVDMGDTELARDWRIMHEKAGGETCRFDDEPPSNKSSCSSTICHVCPPAPHASAVALSRALVGALYDGINDCESNSTLRSAEKRPTPFDQLYTCIHKRLRNRTRFVGLPGIHTEKWSAYVAGDISLVDPKERANLALTFSGFDASRAETVMDEFLKLHELSRLAEQRHFRLRGSRFVSIQDVLDHLGCGGSGYWRTDSCIPHSKR